MVKREPDKRGKSVDADERKDGSEVRPLARNLGSIPCPTQTSWVIVGKSLRTRVLKILGT